MFEEQTKRTLCPKCFIRDLIKKFSSHKQQTITGLNIELLDEYSFWGFVKKLKDKLEAVRELNSPKIEKFQVIAVTPSADYRCYHYVAIDFMLDFNGQIIKAFVEMKKFIGKVKSI